MEGPADLKWHKDVDKREVMGRVFLVKVTG